MKHGMDFVGEIMGWLQRPEDPIDTYKRITNISQESFNDEIFDAARRFVNWDIDGIREYGKGYVGRAQANLEKLRINYYMIHPQSMYRKLWIQCDHS